MGNFRELFSVSPQIQKKLDSMNQELKDEITDLDDRELAKNQKKWIIERKIRKKQKEKSPAEVKTLLLEINYRYRKIFWQLGWYTDNSIIMRKKIKFERKDHRKECREQSWQMKAKWNFRLNWGRTGLYRWNRLICKYQN